jgi:lipoate-protein ligase B
MKCLLLDPGLTDYKTAYELQKRYVELVKSKAIEGALILTEHKPVFTLGRSARNENLLVSEETARARGIDIVYADRGGDITFHGPGQLIAYPIIDLTWRRKDIHTYIRDIEEMAIRILADFDITAFRIKYRSGAWTASGKLASIGIGISRWVSYHGLAINASVDLSYFDMINPCGMKDIRVASISQIKGSSIDLCLIKERLLSHFCSLFSCNIIYSDFLFAI